MAEEENLEKPFKCYHQDCDMRFTNEDHLSVHMKKHDMSLALNLGSGLGGLSPLAMCDQTPTPTKFLKNCEELGLFQELSKNPFEDSFKKAMDSSGDEPDSSDISGIPGPGGMLNLDTPLPSNIQIPKIVTEHVDDVEIKSPTKTGTLSSIVPKKREKYLSSHVYPTSTTSEDEEKHAPTSTNTENDTKMAADSVDDLLGNGSDVLDVSTTKMEHTLDNDSVNEMLADAAELIAKSPTVAKLSSQGYTFVKNKLVTSSTQSFTIVTNQTPAVTSPSKPAALPNNVTMQALLQLPNGQTIPIQLPGSLVNQQQTQVVPVQTGIPPKNSSLTSQKTVSGILQGNISQFIQTVPQVVQQRSVVKGVVQTVTGATHNLPVGLVQNQVTRAVPLQTVKVGPSPLTQTVHTVPVQQTLNQSVLATVISPEKQTVTQTKAGVKTVIAPQIVVQSAQRKSAISPKPQTQSLSKTSPNQGSQTYTKQRLKAALTGSSNPSSSMKINHIFKMVEEVRNEQQQQQQSQDALSVASTSETLSSPDETPVPAKQTKFEFSQADSEDSEDKRRKFLERNRAAAARCRQKRKSWIYNLESKAEELTNVNTKLQKEITSLRGEVAHLKKLLIAHKDCPVTLQQKSTGQILTQQPVHQEESSQSSESTDLEPIEILPAVNGNVPANSSVPNIPVINVDPLGASFVASTNTVPMATGVITGPDTVPLTLDPSGVPLIASTSGVPIATGVIQGPVTGVVTGPDSVPMVTSVLTGPNTVAMIPTIVNLDFYTKQEPT